MKNMFIHLNLSFWYDFIAKLRTGFEKVFINKVSIFEKGILYQMNIYISIGFGQPVL